jgi:hypothetical protein
VLLEPVVGDISIGDVSITEGDLGTKTATSTVILTGSATAADYQTALHQVGFNNTTNNDDTTARTINVVVNEARPIPILPSPPSPSIWYPLRSTIKRSRLSTPRSSPAMC